MAEEKSVKDKILEYKDKFLKGLKGMVKEAAEMPSANPMGMADKTTVEQMKKFAEKNKGR